MEGCEPSQPDCAAGSASALPSVLRGEIAIRGRCVRGCAGGNGRAATCFLVEDCVYGESAMA